MTTEPYLVRLPKAKEIKRRLSEDPNIDDVFIPFIVPHAEEEMTGIGILLMLVFASISISDVAGAGSLVVHFGKRIVDHIVEDPQMNTYVKMLIREEFEK